MKQYRPQVLIVEDVPTLAATYKSYLATESLSISTAHTGAEALAKLSADPPDLAIVDVQLPDASGIDILRRIRADQLPTEVIVVTSNGSVSLAIEAIREGAADFLVKPFSADRLRITAGNALSRSLLARSIQTITEQFATDRFCDFVGESLAMQSVYQIIRSAAHSKASVFVVGESGTGKGLCANALHKLSPRSGGPLIAINCAAIPRDLLESELFGHVKGAFTGATGDRIGAALMADGGTLFLDEICEMELPFQAKLLRFLETGTVVRVGETVARPSDIRIVCATNRDPWEEVRAGRFRENLLYRLHVLPIELPPLREREGDVLLLARTILNQFAQEDGKTFDDFTPEAQTILLKHKWPGNVRELRNVIRQIVVLGTGGVVTAAMLPPAISSATTNEIQYATVPSAANGSATSPQSIDGIKPLDQCIEEAIDQAVALCGGSIPKAAEALKVSPSTIYRRLQARVGRT